ncbi:hypothetical protein EHS25_008846 [Saitozyma podzolica]|uniref:glutathione transferase n=1 Tax=Saitozyma podzolica TaxID=1890683 RepID=A0A427YN11_9TREE|nr:hypothetical protein EHS25_008846 [Saitozyma podzolica]
MVLVIHGIPFSGIGILDAKHYRIEPATPEILKSEEYLAKHPFGQIPVMEDTETGAVIYESRVICKYIANKFHSPLLPSPTDLAAWIAFEQACSIEASRFDTYASPLARETVLGPARGIPTDHHVVEKFKPLLQVQLRGYDRILGKQRYLAGEKLTLVDLFHLSYGETAVAGGAAPGLIDGSLPNVARWWKEISSLPAWSAAKALTKG